MNKDKQIDLIRKRNIELNEQLEQLKKNLMSNNINMDYSEELLDNLEDIRITWENAIKDLDEKRNEYQALITDVKKIKDILFRNSLTSKISLLDRIKISILRFKNN